MKPQVGIIVGHYGRGTGASHRGRDEWGLALQDAYDLYRQLYNEDLVQPLFFYINREELRWKILGELLSATTSLSIKVNWLRELRPAFALELHYNSYFEPARGHEVLAPEYSRLAGILARELDALPNRSRETKIRTDLHILRGAKEAGIPLVITEPAFLCEDVIDSDTWRPQLVRVLKKGVYEYAGAIGELEDR